MIRNPVVAGTFYPSDREHLSSMITDFMSSNDREPDSSITGLVSPHAGYVYSGAVAGAAFASAPAVVSTVVILAPTHSYPVHGASVYRGEGYLTPLGVAVIDSEITSGLLDSGLSFQAAAHRGEHSAEVQIPFIQTKWPDASIVVVLQGSVFDGHSRTLAENLHDVLKSKKDILIVASSDLSHYHPYSEAERMDRKVIEAFTSGNPDNLNAVLSGGSEACGGGPMLTLMHYSMLNGSEKFGEIMWDTSATASGDRNSVVGYFAGYTAKEARE